MWFSPDKLLGSQEGIGCTEKNGEELDEF